MLDEISIKEFLVERIEAIYQSLQQGHDVSPGDRLRLEGQIELMLVYDVIDREWIEEFVKQRYQYFFKQTVDDVHWQWVEQDQHFYLPVKMQEAPVYKA